MPVPTLWFELWVASRWTSYVSMTDCWTVAKQIRYPASVWTNAQESSEWNEFKLIDMHVHGGLVSTFHEWKDEERRVNTIRWKLDWVSHLSSTTLYDIVGLFLNASFAHLRCHNIQNKSDLFSSDTRTQNVEHNEIIKTYDTNKRLYKRC